MMVGIKPGAVGNLENKTGLVWTKNYEPGTMCQQKPGGGAFCTKW